MKREDVKKQIPGITDEQLNWIMQENGSDINREKSAAAALQTQLDNANAQLKTAQDGLKAFEGKKKPEEYEAELTKLKADMKAQADGFAFDNALNTAIMGKKGRSVKAVRALLDVDALKGSTDRSTDIAKALDDAAKANPWAFGEDGAAGGRRFHRRRTWRTARQRVRWCGSRLQIPEPRTEPVTTKGAFYGTCKSGALLRSGRCKAAGDPGHPRQCDLQHPLRRQPQGR